MEHAPPDVAARAFPAGDVDWDAAYLELAPRVYNYFRFRVGSKHEAEDLTSRTFEKAWRSRERYRRDLGAFSNWLFGIAQNVCSDYLQRRSTLVPIDAIAEIPADGSPEQDAERGSDIARLAALTALLPARERDLIALKYGAEMNNRSIARLTGLSESNVGTTLHRVVQSIRAQWYAP
jgi:RNA polymerase sigma-70 factor (ECF subfamily)